VNSETVYPSSSFQSDSEFSGIAPSSAALPALSGDGDEPASESLMEWYIRVWQRYAEFSGRSRRMEYWMFTLVHGIIILVLVLGITGFGIMKQPAIGATSGLIAGAYGLAALIPCFAVTVRRLHDTDKSGWWILISLVPIVGGIALLVMTVLDGTRGSNQYGPDPKGAPKPAPIG
jgi:uncharacterized membrane protein YhaH (DUF805 family)